MKTRDSSTYNRAGWCRAAVVAAMLGALAAPAWAADASRDGALDTKIQIAAAATGRPVTVEISKHKFSMTTVTVPVGGTVTWLNHDEDVHTIVSTTQVFRSPGLDTDESYSYKFTKPGVYQYFCTLHPLMTGTVIVK